MTGTAQLVEGPVEPQPAALMRAHPRDRLGLAVDPTHEPDHRTDVKGIHHAAGTSALAATTCQLPSLVCIEGLLARERPSEATRSVAAPATTPTLPASAAADAATTTCLRVACGPLGGRRFPGRPVSMRPAGAGGRSGSLRLAHRWPYGRHAIR